MTVIFRSLVFITAVLMSATGFAAPFDGLYTSVDGTWSCNPEDLGMDGGVLGIQGAYLHGLENTCELTKPTSIRGMDAVLFDAQCSGEGEQYSYRVMIMRHEEGLYLVQDGLVADWRRCQ
ncbi:hypothetical protein EBB79_06925 [Parasedimentitalea marina]|uniref:Uncharacterized protein n=1 Tax=Parasedimentitalea marina TaxID=2483033 RepID=A0A3T0N0X5_9RHOB|nr:hypothetical protein [Parasedimentitalea marina]AZV77651.1 hypothetical protein EBB79_06925 [Parasedimentitalea marina]